MPRLNANSFDDPAWAIVAKGWNEYANGRFAEAIASYTTALESFNERTPSAAIMETYVCRGAAFGRAGNVHSAIDDFTKAIELDAQSENAFFNRGIARQQLEQYALAIEDFGRSIELRPTDKRNYIRRGVCRKRLNDVLGARRDFAEARRLIDTEEPKYRTKGEKPPPRLIDAPMRCPPPPGTCFYVCFALGPGWDGRPLEERLTAVADSPQDALEQILRDGKGPIDSRLKCAHVTWIDHNRNARTRIWWLGKDNEAGTT
jgi:tetratricopeptide (TPR) repeat protein